MLATATPFNIMDENLGVIKKPGNNKTVKKAVFFDENAVGAQTPTMVQKPGLAPKSSTRRALGDLNSNQLNQRTPIATKSGAIGSELKKSGLKPMPSSSKSSLKGSGTSSNAPKTADAATKPAIVPATEVEEEFDVSHMICSRRLYEPMDIYDVTMAKAEAITLGLWEGPWEPGPANMELYEAPPSQTLFEYVEEELPPLPAPSLEEQYLEITMEIPTFDL